MHVGVCASPNAGVVEGAAEPNAPNAEPVEGAAAGAPKAGAAEGAPNAGVLEAPNAGELAAPNAGALPAAAAAPPKPKGDAGEAGAPNPVY